MTRGEAVYVQRAFRDFFGITSQPINVTDDGDEQRQYILRVKATEADGTKRMYMVESLADAIRVVAVEDEAAGDGAAA